MVFPPNILSELDLYKLVIGPIAALGCEVAKAVVRSALSSESVFIWDLWSTGSIWPDLGAVVVRPFTLLTIVRAMVLIGSHLARAIMADTLCVTLTRHWTD